MARKKNSGGSRRTPQKGNGNPPRRPGHLHPKLPAAGKQLASHYGWIATKTLVKAATEPESFAKELEAAQRAHGAFDVLGKVETPYEVRQWMKENCGLNGPVHQAFAEQVAQSMWHALLGPKERAMTIEEVPGHLVDGVRKQEKRPAAGWPCCAPFCPPP